MNNLVIKENEILFSRYGELIRISPCGNNAIRFQSFPDCQVIDENYTLMPEDNVSCEIVEEKSCVFLTCGKLKCKLEKHGKTIFYIDEKPVIVDKSRHTFEGNGDFRRFENKGSGNWSVSANFEAHDGEHFFGLGHSWDNAFDLKGSTIDLCHLNAKVTIPYVYSSLGYGFIWNNPSPGLCELAYNRTRWTSDNAKFMDYVVIAGTPKEACTTLADLTGYTQTGWAITDGGEKAYDLGAEYATDASVTLYPYWTADTYIVTLVANGGTVNVGDITEYTYGVGATLPTDVTRSGYTFKGWYTGAELDGEAVTEISATDIGEKVFFAKWQKKASGTVVTNHKCTSVCEVCGGCTDAKCQKDVCDNKCLEISMAFKDVAEDAWYAESVKYVYHHGIMKGVSDTEFDIGGSTTRAMIVTTLWRLEGEPVVNYAMTFADVRADAYYAEAVRWAASEGLVLGYSAEEFRPDTAITREQMAAIIYRYAQYKDVAPTGAWAIRLEFADALDIADYATEAVMYCTMKNLMQGRDGGVFAPQDTATRAEIAVVLHRFIVNSK